jgi:hypothetical protein
MTQQNNRDGGDNHGCNVDIRCGSNLRAGFIGVDRFVMKGVSVFAELAHFPWPFRDGSLSALNFSRFALSYHAQFEGTNWPYYYKGDGNGPSCDRVKFWRNSENYNIRGKRIVGMPGR